MQRSVCCKRLRKNASASSDKVCVRMRVGVCERVCVRMCVGVIEKSAGQS